MRVTHGKVMWGCAAAVICLVVERRYHGAETRKRFQEMRDYREQVSLERMERLAAAETLSSRAPGESRPEA